MPFAGQSIGGGLIRAQDYLAQLRRLLSVIVSQRIIDILKKAEANTRRLRAEKEAAAKKQDR